MQRSARRSSRRRITVIRLHAFQTGSALVEQAGLQPVAFGLELFAAPLTCLHVSSGKTGPAVCSW